MRASSIGDFADCPARWYAKHIEQLSTPAGPAALIGTALHASTAEFDRARMHGLTSGSFLTAADTAGIASDEIMRPKRDVDWSLDDSWTPQKAAETALALHVMYCDKIGSQRQYLAVERNLGSLDIATENGTVRVTGTTDRLRAHSDGRVGPSDQKSGKTAVSADGTVPTKGHAYQLAAYSLLARANTDIEINGPAEIIGMNTGKTAAAQRVETAIVEDIETPLLGDESRPGLLEIAAGMAKHGLFYGNPKSMLCGEKYCPVYHKCMFRR